MQTIILLLPSMVSGLKTSLALSVITLIISLPLSVGVALLRMSKLRILRYISSAYIYVMRGTPLLLQLMFVFFGLPYLNIVLQREHAAVLAFVLNYSAYFAEIVRGGLESIDKGQYEASKVLGINKNTCFFKIILPQVIKTILPAMGNETITLIKDTSLVYILGLGDLLRAGKIGANTFSSMVPFAMVGLIYLFIIALVAKLFALTEKHFKYYE